MDDDLLCGSEWFHQDVVPKLRQRFKFGTWSEHRFTHVGLEIDQDPATFEVDVGQASYAMTMKKVYAALKRRQTPGAPATPDDCMVASQHEAGARLWLVADHAEH